MDLLGKNKGTLTDFKDPFSKNKIDKINIFIYRGMFDETRIIHSATVKFKDGNTSGAQEFEADNFAELINKIDSFVENL